MNVYLAAFVGVLPTALTPVPEETALLAAGWFARRADASLVVVTACAWAAIVIGDVATFALGRALVRGLAGTSRLQRLFPPRRRQWAEDKVARHGWRAILLARFLVGMRVFLYLALGGSGYSFRRFVVLDAVVGVVEVAMVVGGGWLVGVSRHARERVEIVDGVAMLLIVGSLVVPWLVHRMMRGPGARGAG